MEFNPDVDMRFPSAPLRRSPLLFMYRTRTSAPRAVAGPGCRVPGPRPRPRQPGARAGRGGGTRRRVGGTIRVRGHGARQAAGYSRLRSPVLLDGDSSDTYQPGGLGHWQRSRNSCGVVGRLDHASSCDVSTADQWIDTGRELGLDGRSLYGAHLARYRSDPSRNRHPFRNTFPMSGSDLARVSLESSARQAVLNVLRTQS